MNEVNIRIDSAENDLREVLSVMQAGYSFGQIPLGDIEFWIKPPGEDEPRRTAVWERKEVHDLAASLSDGRFRDQRTRMLLERKDNPDLNLVFLIEGDMAYFDDQESDAVRMHELCVCQRELNTLQFGSDSPLADKNLTKADRDRLIAIYTKRTKQLNYQRSNWSKQYVANILQDLGGKYGISVLYSDSMLDTVRLIGRYEKVLRDQGDPRQLAANAAVVNVMQTGRKKGMTPQEFFPCALSLVPGLSREAALAVAAEWSSFDELMNGGYAFDSDVDDDFEAQSERAMDLLAGLEYGGGKKINKPTSRRVYQFVYGFGNKQEPRKPKKTVRRAKRATFAKSKGKKKEHCN